MRHIYTVTGMTCAGCKFKVEHLLSEISGVEKVSAYLEKGEVVIDMYHHISTDVFQKALPEKYSISEKTPHHVPTADFETVREKSEWKQLFPLFLIFGYLTVASVLMNINPWDTDGFMFDFMGLFFIVFSFFKMLDLKGFPDSFRMYDPLAKRLPVYASIYPFIETVLGLMFLMRLETSVALMVTIVILGVTTIGVTKVLLDKKSIQCACLGTALKLPMTKATFIENAVMIGMSVIMVLRIYFG